SKVNKRQITRDHDLPYDKFCRRWNGRKSKSTRDPTNRLLNDEQDLALCEFLRRLDYTGVTPMKSTITLAANTLLRKAHSGSGKTPTAGTKWTSRWLKAHPDFHVKKQ
ncbi:hypothetical protein BJ508DRAFT_183619, partial [Ascobolus immersus RN42]